MNYITLNYNEKLRKVQLINFEYSANVNTLSVAFQELTFDEKPTDNVFSYSKVGNDSITLYNLFKTNGIRELYIALCDSLQVDNSIVPEIMEEIF